MRLARRATLRERKNIIMIDTYDIVVVGAGPVGLATAIGLQQRGISNFLVLDQTRDFRRVGQVIDRVA